MKMTVLVSDSWLKLKRATANEIIKDNEPRFITMLETSHQLTINGYGVWRLRSVNVSSYDSC